MWSSKLCRLLLAASLTLPLAGCFRPLYGPTASGVPVQQSLAAIEVAKVTVPQGQEQLSHYLRSELVFELDGSGTVSQKRYQLAVNAAEAIQITITDTITGRADAAQLNVTARYTLTSLDGKREVLTGTAKTSATYFRDPQRFASVRAARDAEIRASKQIAEEIKNRIAAHFATTR
ncbi:LPS assembly lipoprotein LptE [Enterovirga rhinocerotis]|uniref:LPS-assembly lipoprotein n=1 Tax=Enterovirga rhinocerotis TaxID=1339210 RepID=A0A4R7BQT9_9HYPH|nr:LPS assembly lipoprotein LptE [Enterovirga rhinocerotis]TDR87122.1 LPS-assembly lipoprotein [Enterovirga rhinocerotis]